MTRTIQWNVTPTSVTVMTDGQQHGWMLPSGKVDLLAGGRDGALERAHAT